MVEAEKGKVTDMEQEKEQKGKKKLQIYFERKSGFLAYLKNASHQSQ